MAVSSVSVVSTRVSSSASAARTSRSRGLQLGAQARGRLDAALEPGDVLAGQVEPERGELGDHGAVAAGGLGLLLERPELAPHLAEQVLDPGEVALGGGQPALGLLLAPPVLEHARRPLR